MAWTKKQFCMQALEEIGYAAYIYDVMPEQLESVLRSLDAMMATWNGQGIRVGYPLSSSPDDASVDDGTNVPDVCNETIYTNLAIRIGPRFGKTIPPETKQIANLSYKALLAKAALPTPMQFPETLPLGQGNKVWRRNNTPFFDVPDDYLVTGTDGPLDFN